MHLNETNGYWYVRRHTSNGKETVAKLGQHDEPRIYRPELYQEKAETLLKRLPADSVDLIVTDPPYGIGFSSNMDEYDGAAEMGGIMNDHGTDWLEDIAAEFERVLRPDSHVYVFTRWDAYRDMAPHFENQFELSNLLVWDKNSHGMGDLSDWAPQHEFIMHFEHGNGVLRGSRPSNVLKYSGFTTADRQIQIHPTQKPRDLIEHIVKKSSDVGDVVLDPFGGAYTTARAAMRSFRRAVSCELDPETHRTAKELVMNQLHSDPEYGIDWTNISNLEVRDVDVAEPIPSPDNVSAAGGGKR